ncbi:hypothetical protein GPJ56_006211 [Histomonas meleagridis]|uniref:uncharacterized protein n=1 Tax=Histomonas meleagridis TaxID=135588 RepID=UPI003559408E|nr:hypothetical protein GPJ56_006211 [Histomonas meleagridis]KAH0796974.1 hypothetical protein GO595_010867 [Histomonas meleagridis]
MSKEGDNKPPLLTPETKTVLKQNNNKELAPSLSQPSSTFQPFGIKNPIDINVPKSIATACYLIVNNYFEPDSTKVHTFHKNIKTLSRSHIYRLRQFEDQDDDDFKSDASFVGPTFTKVHFPKNMQFSSSSDEESSEDTRDSTEVLSPSVESSTLSSRITNSTSNSSYSSSTTSSEETTESSSTTTTQEEEEEEDKAEDKEEEK